MKNFAPTAFLLALAVSPAACTWVEPSISGGVVRVAYDGNVRGCRDAGAVAVTVADKIWFYHRNDVKVRDELETLARNEAANLPADTIIPISEPVDGSQRFRAYVCGRTQVRERAPSDAPTAEPAAAPDGVQTFPLKQH